MLFCRFNTYSFVVQVIERMNAKVCLEEGNSQTPHIKFLGVFLAIEQLRGHIESGAYKLIACSSSLERSEVSDFIGFIDTDNVLRLDVSVNKLFAVNSIESFGGIKTDFQKLFELDMSIHGDQDAK